jgi:anti-anti-sigma factor
MPDGGSPLGAAEPRRIHLRSDAEGAGQDVGAPCGRTSDAISRVPDTGPPDATAPGGHAPADLRTEFFTGRRHGDVLVLSGEIDLPNAAAVSDWIASHVAAGVVHLDLSQVTYCGAAGVRALLAGRDALPPGGATLAMTCSPLVLRVLQICDLPAASRIAIVTTKPTVDSPPEAQ